MNTNSKLAIALAAGVALGVTATQMLRAQAKPPAYVVAEIDVTNKDAFLKDFVPIATKALAQGAGFKALARGSKTMSIEGAAPKSIVAINHFDSLDEALKAYNSEAYKEARKIGNKYATFRLYAVEGFAQ